MSVDYSHHLSREALARPINPMKAVRKVILATGRDPSEFAALANGNVHPTLFAVSQIDFRVPDIRLPQNIVDNWRNDFSPSRSFSIGVGQSPSQLEIPVGLQYGTGAGTIEMMDILQELNAVMHRNLPHNCVTLHSGSADGATKLFRLLANPGESLLVEEFSYPGITNSLKALGARWEPVKMDHLGLIPEDMDHILETWDENLKGRRPHILYLIPCGQNPTGSTLPIDRRQAIYKLAQKWDLIIIEDDPYYSLQFPSEKPSTNGHINGHVTGARDPLPSLLSMDVDGRVIRLDTFSKILAPGFRLGWYTSHPFFQLHLERLTDDSVQHPNGFSQLCCAKLLSPPPQGWGFDGYTLWCEKLSEDYRKKRDLFVNVLKHEFDEDWGKLAFADIPTSGMFIRFYVSVEKHETFKRIESAKGPKTNTVEIIDKLLQELLDRGLVIMPGKAFAHVRDELDDIYDRCNFFRITYSASDDTLLKGAKILAAGVKDFFKPN